MHYCKRNFCLYCLTCMKCRCISDSVMMMAGYSDVIVMRHPTPGVMTVRTLRHLDSNYIMVMLIVMKVVYL